MLLYYITDRRQFPGGETKQRQALLRKISEAARCGVDFIQLREKDLGSRELEILGRAAVDAVRSSSSSTRLLINSRTDVAIACGADGVHLRGDDVTPGVVRRVWPMGKPVLAVSCHSVEDIHGAADADLVVYGPVFEKGAQPGIGIERLREACGAGIPVVALGGVNSQNAAECLRVGATGVAGIRLFQEVSLPEIVDRLREIGKNLTAQSSH